MKLSKTTKSIRSITLTAMLLAVLVVQEYLLTGIPQVQLTVILIVVYARFLSYDKLIPLLVAYVLLDNLLMGSLNPIYTPAMLVMWPLLGVVSRKMRHREDYTVLIMAVVFSFVYGWSFLPARIIEQQMYSWNKILTYLYYDIPFEIAMAANTVATFLIFFQPLNRLLDFMFKRSFPNDYKSDDMSL